MADSIKTPHKIQSTDGVLVFLFKLYSTTWPDHALRSFWLRQGYVTGLKRKLPE